MKTGAFGKPLNAAPPACPATPPAMTLATTAVPEVAALREALELHRSALLDRLNTGEDGMALGRANARFLDGLLRARFEAAAAPPGFRAAGSPSRRWGSFGRGAVALRSDADVMVVVAPPSPGYEGGRRICRGSPLPALGHHPGRRAPGAQRERRGAAGAEGPRHSHRAARLATPRRRRGAPGRPRRTCERRPLRRAGPGWLHRTARGRGGGSPRTLRRVACTCSSRT